MLQKLLTLLVLVMFISVGIVQSKDDRTNRTERTHKVSDGSEIYDNTNNYQPKFGSTYYPPVHGASLTYTFSNTGVFTVYDLQSNGVPMQIWQDPLTPANVHATFMYSTEAGFASRNCAYMFSNDGGATWTFLGDVPNTGRSGFPAISGYTSGGAVIANHNNTNGTTTRAKTYFDAGAGFGVFTESDPGDAAGAQSIWPRVVGIGSDRQVIASSINGQVLSYTNSSVNGTWSGFAEFPGDQAETYSLSVAPNGTIGHAFIGAGDGVNDNDVFYRSSADNGVTWTAPQRIWDWNEATDSLGCLRGVSLVMGNNNQPYVVFNISILTLAGFFPETPSSIRLWSPAVNGGTPIIMADQSTVPFFPNRGQVGDAFLPICRPSIGRGSTGDGLYCAFSATTGEYGTDTSAYYAVWFSYSGNNGATWSAPERVTPTTPVRDWRFVSVSQVNNTTGGATLVQMLVQSDSLAGTHVNGSPIGSGEAIGIRTNVQVGINNISSVVPGDFSLAQNFPNPFNPTTNIRFDIRNTSNVTLKVYNANGQEVATLVNNEVVTPGTKEVTFIGNNLSSGIYFYTLFAGDFKETKKMMLIK
ncbi:MAG: T9SS type A sorting domain-containing protein [Ignavibacteria bacterium]|nr:T9SS type A sorting domain-containing protein [Ignavibacteria bacterium]